MQTLNDEEKEKCRTSTGLFEVLSAKFRTHDNETNLSLQYCKLVKEQNGNAKEWIGHPE